MLGRRHTVLEHSTCSPMMMAGTRKQAVNRLCVHNGFLLSFTDIHNMICKAANVSIPLTHARLKDHRTSTSKGQSSIRFAASSDWNDLLKSLKIDSFFHLQRTVMAFLKDSYHCFAPLILPIYRTVQVLKKIVKIHFFKKDTSNQQWPNMLS